jgi:hypothetical protein
MGAGIVSNAMSVGFEPISPMLRHTQMSAVTEVTKTFNNR